MEKIGRYRSISPSHRLLIGMDGFNSRAMSMDKRLVARPICHRNNAMARQITRVFFSFFFFLSPRSVSVAGIYDIEALFAAESASRGETRDINARQSFTVGSVSIRARPIFDNRRTRFTPGYFFYGSPRYPLRPSVCFHCENPTANTRLGARSERVVVRLKVKARFRPSRNPTLP